MLFDNIEIEYDVPVTGGTTAFSNESVSSSITVEPSTAPTLLGANNLGSISEDDVTNSGTLVSDLISGQITAGNTNELAGIAIIAVDNTNGTWEYTTDGTTWQAIGSPSFSTALLLASDGNNAIRFVPDAEWSGTISNGVTFHAWDQTSGTDGAVADLQTTFTVLDQFDSAAYNNNDGSVNWNSDWTEVSDDGSATSGRFEVLSNDSDNRLALEADSTSDYIYRAVDLSGATSADLSFDYKNRMNNAFFGDVVIELQITKDGFSNTTTLVTFSENINQSSSFTSFSTSISATYFDANTEIRFKVTDSDSGNEMYIDNFQISYVADATAFSADSASSSLVVNAVNDVPVLDLDANNSSTATGVDYQGSFTEGGSAVSIADIDTSISDADDTNIESATITLTNAQTLDILVAGSLPAGITASSYNSGTGVITLSGSATLAEYETAIEAINFNSTNENPNTVDRVITVVINDGDDNSSSATSTISVTAVDVGDVSTPSDSDVGTNTVAENATVGSTVGITASASDPDAHDDITFSLSDDAGGLFQIDATTGVVTVAAALDAETATSHNITILATSDDGSTSNQTFAISVTDIDEVDIGAVSDTDGGSNTIAENAVANTTVGITALATDADVDDNTTYSLTDDAGGLFQINASTGVVTLVSSGSLDAETATSHNITVLATSDDGSTNSAVMSIAVTDIDEADVGLVTDSNASANTVGANAVIGTPVNITASAADSDVNDNITYSLSNDAGGLFAIDVTTGVVTVNGALVAVNTHNITVLATSEDGSTSSVGMSIDVTATGSISAIIDSNLGNNSIAENATVGTVVGITALANDPDVSDTVSYSLSDDAGGLFQINASTGVVTLVAALLDAETTTSHNITVKATSSDTSFTTEVMSIAVTDIDEADVGPVTDSNASANTVAENATVGTVVDITGLASDSDVDDDITYSLSDSAGGLFQIDATTGIVTVAGMLDAETATSHNITILATSDDGSTSNQTYSIAVTDIDEVDIGLVSDGDGSTNAIVRNAVANTTVGITALATDADVNDNTTYSLSDSAGGLFQIDANTGVVSLVTTNSLIAEAATSLNITVLATSGDGSTNSAVMSINLSPIDDFDVGLVTDSNLTNNTIAENATVGTTVNITALASDDDITDNITYSLSDSAGGLFQIDATTGVVTLAATLDAETATSHNITVLATSDDTSTSSQTFTINVTDIDEVDIGAVSDSNGGVNTIAENALANTTVGITALATDADVDDSTTYSLSDDAGGLFQIDASSGVVSLVTGGSLDAETATSHNITVLATSDDGSSNSAVMSITVTDIDEADVGPVTDSDASVNTVAENATVGTVVNITGLATDSDLGDSIAYSLSDSAGGLFQIDASTGVVTVAATLDAETATSHNITILATSDDGSTSNQSFAINVTDIDEVNIGVVTDSNGGVNTIAENALANTTVGITALAIDADVDDNTTYSLSDDADGLFQIDASSGVVSLVSGGSLDAETVPSYNITVLALSGDGSTNAAVMNIAVIDVNEFDVGAILDSNVDTNTVAENATVGTIVNITGLATDDDTGDSVTYSLSDDAGGLFEINAITGEVTVAAVLDAETATSHNITVLATSDDTSTSSQTFSINVTNIDEVDVGVITNSDNTLGNISADGSIAEDAVANTVVGITATATDGDIDSNITYSLSDDANGLFQIDTNTGVVSLVESDSLNAEADTSHSITVLATSNDGSTSSAVMTIAVTDVDEFDVGEVTDSDLAENTVAENASAGSPVNITGFATDSDVDDNITYSLSDDAGGLFQIDSTTGEVTVAGELDAETATSHNITIENTSDDGSTSSRTFTITVTDVNEIDVHAINESSLSELESTQDKPSVDLSTLVEETESEDEATETSVTESPAAQESPGELPIGVAESMDLSAMIDDAIINMPADDPIIASNFDIRADEMESKEKRQEFQFSHPKSLDLLDLETIPFEVESLDPLNFNAVINNTSFVSGIKLMTRDLDEAFAEEEEDYRIDAQVTMGATLSFTAGVVSWILRSGSLAASFISVVPLWQRLDPLPILGAAAVEKRKDVRRMEEQEEDGKDENDKRVEDLFNDETD